MKKCPKCGIESEGHYNRCKSCFASLDGCSVADGARQLEQDEDKQQEGEEVPKEDEGERGELLSGHAISWWENLRGTCCAVGVVLTVLIGVFATGLDQSDTSKDGQKQVERPRVYVNEKGNLVRRKCDSSGSASHAVLIIGGMIIAWGYIWWLRFLIKERISGEAWWFEGGWLDFNKKLAQGYVLFEALVLHFALISVGRMLHWRLAWYCWFIIGAGSALVAEIITYPLFKIIIGKGISQEERCIMEQLDKRAMNEIQREEEYKADKPFRAERWNYPSKEMLVLGTYATFDEAKKRMVEAVEIAYEQEQGLSREEARKRIDKAESECCHQLCGTDGKISSVFMIPAPLHS